MKELFFSEWQKIWKRKSTWICFASIPLVLCMITKYLLKTNIKINYSSFKYITFLRVPSETIRMSVMYFDIIIVLLIVISITSEYSSGEVRLTMLRAKFVNSIIKSKFLVVLSVIFLFLTIYLAISFALEYLFFPYEKTKFTDYTYIFTTSEAVLYNIKYYIITFINLSAIATVLMFICILCKSSTGAVAGSLIFILVSSIYPTICSIILNEKSKLIEFSSLISIQEHGIFNILSENPQNVEFIVFIITVYILVFSFLSFDLLSNRDYYI